ncbi:MAG TPA: bifunctional phosphopantothenoylcysteine decarboxylase/phosphopantothenate--cysteine ligase CoaBC [Desulfomicrobiaceae bacterium]|nr:bifunctional phosphopantothenoylcysteine decarboxylase/phosphopantothenate--cysteine ligase CoaBC [Desulfomicrobiaceae bacterium]
MIPAHYLFDCFPGRRVHLGVSGSIAAFRGLDLLRALTGNNLRVSATVTPSAAQFVTPLSFESLGAEPVYQDMFVPGQSPYAHLEPGQECDALIICPATANTLARMAHGLADDMLSCQALSFAGPVVVAPSMNPGLWNAPATRENWKTLMDRGVIGVGPVQGNVACGDTGTGRLAPVSDIFVETLRALSPRDLQGTRVLVTLGPTREFFDRVRFWSNPSSGTMGACVAVAAWLRGAEVHVVHGPISLELPAGIQRTAVTTAKEMFTACMDLWPNMDAGCFTAAVADFSPEPYPGGKLKKEDTRDGLHVDFTPNPDILYTVGHNKKPGQRLIGFAAEAGELPPAAKRKLDRKNLDLIVANRIDQDEGGFGATTNSVLMLDNRGQSRELVHLHKTKIAWRIWDWISGV